MLIIILSVFYLFDVNTLIQLNLNCTEYNFLFKDILMSDLRDR